MNILIYSHSSDGYAIDPVVSALRARGATPWVLETDRYPGEVGLCWKGPGEGWLELPGQGRISLAEIDAVWFRRDEVGARLPVDLEPQVRAATIGEAREVLMGALLDANAFWLDPPAVQARARSKALQLVLAREAGLQVPRTLEGNDPDAARDFAASCPGGVVAKMYNDLRLGEGTVYTNLLGPEDLDALDELAACPMILQEAIPKRLELRAVVVGEQVFAVALDTPSHAGAEVDWRRVGAETVSAWVPYALPDEVRAALLRLHDRLHTNYGSADLVLSPDGRHVFIENNVVGESFWLYEHHPLAGAIADLLMGRAPRRRVPRNLG